MATWVALSSSSSSWSPGWLPLPPTLDSEAAGPAQPADHHTKTLGHVKDTIVSSLLLQHILSSSTQQQPELVVQKSSIGLSGPTESGRDQEDLIEAKKACLPTTLSLPAESIMGMRAAEIQRQLSTMVSMVSPLEAGHPTGGDDASPSSGKSTPVDDSTTTADAPVASTVPLAVSAGSLAPAPRLNKFVRRLHDMLKVEQKSGLVEWRRGLLVLHDTATFAKSILPKYFNTRNFKTFRRQLNYYGFVHVRSFSSTGHSTTALWVNQDLASSNPSSLLNGSGLTSSDGAAASDAAEDLSLVLQLRRVEPCEAAKTAEGRRVRKEMALHTVEEDLGVCPKTLQMEQIRTMALLGHLASPHHHLLSLTERPSPETTCSVVPCEIQCPTVPDLVSTELPASSSAAPSSNTRKRRCTSSHRRRPSCSDVSGDEEEDVPMDSRRAGRRRLGKQAPLPNQVLSYHDGDDDQPEVSSAIVTDSAGSSDEDSTSAANVLLLLSKA